MNAVMATNGTKPDSRPQPAVYRIYLEQCSQDELFQLYSEEILMGARTSEVETAMIEYISRNIEPVGWKAVWRGTKRSSGLPVDCDFLVEIFDVSLEKLQATVSVMEVLECPGAEIARESAELELLLNPNLTPDICIPIIELYPLCEGDEQETLFLPTAVTIEHVRCFYKYLWRPWDEDDDDDVFSEKYLSHRLKFFLDLKNKVIPESLAMQAEKILQEGWKLHSELDCITQDLQTNDTEQDLDEENVRKIIQLRLKLEELQKQMELMENPLVRTLTMTTEVGLPTKSKNESCHIGPVFRIIGTSFPFGKMKELNLNEDDVLEFHHNVEEALCFASSLDTILIFPGFYKCGALNWLESSVTIKGLGINPSDVVIEGLGGSGDFFFNSNSPSLWLENLTLRPSKDMVSTVIVHSGELHMTNCIIYGGNSCLVLLPEAKAEATLCDFLNAQVDGIQLRVSSTLTLNMCKICHCKNTGILLNGCMNWTDDDGCTKLSIQESSIIQNHHNNVLFECQPNQDFLNEDITWDAITKVPWLNVSITGVCELGTIGLKYLEPAKRSIFSPPNDYLCFMESVEANHFHWSYDEADETVKSFAFEDSSDDESPSKSNIDS